MKIQEFPDLWRYLAATDKSVVLYGMGNGADKILAVCERYGITVSDFFASDGFVRGHSFHGKTVRSYSEVKEIYGKDRLIALLSFGSSLPEVLDLFDRVDREIELYAPDVPVCGENLFNREFYDRHRGKIEEARELFADGESRRIYEEVLAYKLDGRISHLRSAVSDRDEVYRELIGAQTLRCTADLGAYNGDTVRELMRYAPGLERVIAMEPDRRNFRKLSEFSESIAAPRVEAIHAAAWSEVTTLSFADSGNRNAGAFAWGKRIEVDALPLDSVLKGTEVDYVKYDVEGAEREALLGSVQTIRRYHPRLLVSAYHRSEDLFALPILIREIDPTYRIYLRRYPYVPAWDLNLICV